MALETSLAAPAPVRQIALAVGQWVDRLGVVWVEGQVAQVNRRQGTQTVFLTLRDSLADISLSVTCPRSLFDALTPPVVEGASVVVQAKPTFYAPRGSFSLAARDIRTVGLGELLARLEQRRQLLAAEGLFDPARKRPLPFLPGTIGLVTAPASAAERDVVEVARRRWPAVRFATRYAAMQGPRSAAEAIEAVRALDADPEVEVIVIARGGGSVEDLLPFSDEGLLRVVSACRTPVVSAIGHDQDSPLLDLVADVRAATPTDAAKLVVPDMADELGRVRQTRDRLRRAVLARVEREQHLVAQLRSRPVLRDPRGGLVERSDAVRELRDRARRALRVRLESRAADLAHQRARVRALSPLETLRRGYAVVRDEHGHLVDGTARPGATVRIRVADAELGATLDSVTALSQEDPT